MIVQESPIYGQDRPKYSARDSNQTPQDPKMWPKRCRVVRFYTSAIFLKIAPKTAKNALKSSPQAGHLRPNLEALGAILAPSWRHLAPFGRDFGRSEPGQNWPKSAKTALYEIFVSKSPPRAPRPPPDLDFSSFQIHFSKVFVNFSEHLFIASALKVYSFLNTFSWIFFGSVPLERSRREGAAVLARRASSIHIYIYINITLIYYLFI